MPETSPVRHCRRLVRAVVCVVWLSFALLVPSAHADVVKPALVEITADAQGVARVEIRASLEAMLTGINARYKNTRDAPQAAAYDALRVLSSAELREKFEPFTGELLSQIWLAADKQHIRLAVHKLDIPDPGYTKVPRISTILLEGPLPRAAASLQLYYPAKFGDSAVRVRQVDKEAGRYHWSEWQWIRTDEPSREFSLTELFTKTPLLQVVSSYVGIGFTHILPKGLDHIMFIVGLFLFSEKLRPLFLQVTMFTLAHTLTLGLSAAGIFDLPERVVQPLIALSIAYVGIENTLGRTLHNSRLALVFGFGLLHGLGFAGILKDFGMAPGAFLISLVSFNIGVELGQVAILLAGYVLLSRWFGSRSWYRARIVVPGSLLIAAIGVFWTFERLELL